MLKTVILLVRAAIGVRNIKVSKEGKKPRLINNLYFDMLRVPIK